MNITYAPPELSEPAITSIRFISEFFYVHVIVNCVAASEISRALRHCVWGVCGMCVTSRSSISTFSRPDGRECHSVASLSRSQRILVYLDLDTH